MVDIPSTKVSIVILTYNGKHHLERYLDGVIRHVPPYGKVVVVDNGSTDGTVEYMENTHPGIELIGLDANYGFAGGYNKAMESITTEYSILLNSDVEIDEDWVTPIIAYLDEHPNVAACQPKVMSLKYKGAFEHAGAAGGWIDILGYPFCMGRIIDSIELDLGQYDAPTEIFWASGAAMVIRTKLFKKAGGLDEIFFAHMEEIDLCYRLKRMGYGIHSFPATRVYHLGGGTLPYESTGKVYLNFRNNLFLLLKNKPVYVLIWLLPVRMILDGVAAIHFLSEGKRGHFRAVFKAHISFYKHFLVMIKKRKIEKATGQKANLKGIYKGSIVWQYYINGRRQFQTIVTSGRIRL